MAQLTSSDRCPAMHPEHARVQCIHTIASRHTHAGWHINNRVTWHDEPTGPVLLREWEAAAWALTDGLGIDLEYSTMAGTIVVNRDALAKWWDRDDRAELIANYEASRIGSGGQ